MLSLNNRFWKKISLGFLNTSHVDSLYRFRKTVVDKVKLEINILKKQDHIKEDKMRIKYANEFIEKMVLVDTTTFVYQIIFDEIYSNDTNVIQYFIMNGLVVCITLNSFVSHIIFPRLLSHNIAVPIAINKNKYFLYLNAYNTVFDWGSGSSNKIEHSDKNNLCNISKVKTV